MGILQKLRVKDREAAIDQLLVQAGLADTGEREEERAAAFRLLAENKARLAAELPAFEEAVGRAAQAKAQTFQQWEQACAAFSAAQQAQSEFLHVVVSVGIDKAKRLLAQTASKRVDELRSSFVREYDELATRNDVDEEVLRNRREALMQAFHASEELAYLPDDQVEAAYEKLRAALPPIKARKAARPAVLED